MIDIQKKKNDRTFVFVSIVFCFIIIVFFLYYIFLVFAPANAISYSTNTISGKASVVFYKAQPQLSVSNRDVEVRLQCNPFSYDNSCVYSIYNNSIMDGDELIVRYLNSTRLPLVNNIVLSIERNGAVLMDCHNRVDELNLNQSYCFDKINSRG